MAIKLHIGCGKRDFGEDWVHIDRAPFLHVTSKDIYLKSMGTSTVDVIYSSHMLAYFSNEEAIELLRCWRRVLKKGGIIRLATPDWSALRKLKDPLPGPIYGQMSEPPIFHKTMYNYDSLKSLLFSVGFKYIRKYDHTATEHAQFDDHSAAYYKGKLISLNVEANA